MRGRLGRLDSDGAQLPCSVGEDGRAVGREKKSSAEGQVVGSGGVCGCLGAFGGWCEWCEHANMQIGQREGRVRQLVFLALDTCQEKEKEDSL